MPIAGRDGTGRGRAAARGGRGLASIDALTEICYRPIYASNVAMIGQDLDDALRKEQKVRENREMAAGPEGGLWVVDG